MDEQDIGIVHAIETDAHVEVRDAAKREIDVRLFPFDTTIETVLGPEEIARGATAGTGDDALYLMEPEHGGVQLGIGQDGSPVPTRLPVGRSTRVWEAPDGAYATFRVARTGKGDESLALALDGILGGVSAEFVSPPGGATFLERGGRRIRRHTKLSVRGAVLTHRPAYGEQAAVLAVRSHQEEAPVADLTPEVAPAIIQTSEPQWSPDMLMSAMSAQFGKPMADIADRLTRVEEQGRSSFEIPGTGTPATPEVSKGQWASAVIRLLSGERLPEYETRVIADLITSENLGVVPPNYQSELIGFIDPARPFLQSTRRVDAGDSGMTQIFPKIVTRPTVGVQATEKTDVASTDTSITTVTYNAVTVAGAGDLSLQLLKRSSPSFLGLYIELLAEALAIKADDLAVDALLAEAAVVEGGVLDPEDASLGAAWATGAAISRRLLPDTIWLSSDAVAAFIDAKANGTNAPLYSNISANFTAAGGTGGSISGLRPVHVPALNDEAVDVLVGPSRGFAWAEDGTYTLSVDVPLKLGRDVALASMFWWMPIYPAAFTSYTLS